jgi:hypothetical protein
MRCQNCDREIMSRTVYCPHCGEQVMNEAGRAGTGMLTDTKGTRMLSDRNATGLLSLDDFAASEVER